MPAGLVTLAHEGTKAYSEAFELVHRREADGPNAIWQADHTPLDILLIRPDAKINKPWLTVVLDDYSRAVAGYFLSFEAPSALHTSLALRQAIWRKQLLKLQLFRLTYEAIRREPTHRLDQEFVFETIILMLPGEHYERMFETFVRWARFSNLFAYDEVAGTLTVTDAAKEE